MFLMNAPPVAALQSKWEAFGPPGTFRFPRCFSESQEGVERAAVSAKVQMLISTLQRDRAALGTSEAPAKQRSQRAERCHDAQPPASPTVPGEQPVFAACSLAASSDPTEQEEASDVGPLELDSDSDDSVDRDIEEAIQEYLKAKSSTQQPVAGGTQPGGAAGMGSRCQLEPLHSGAPATLCPQSLVPVSSGDPGGQAGVSEALGSASPVSVSSDDSFEQSIRAEIEQFLSKKRQHETQRCDGPADKQVELGENSARSPLRTPREPAMRAAPPQGLSGACREFVFRKPPRLAKANIQPRSLRSRVTAEPETVGSTRPATPCRPTEAAQSRGQVRRSVGGARRGRRVRSAALAPRASDSSSDDGIEEAIQLYQWEKTRKEANEDPPPRAQPQEEKGPDAPTNSMSSSVNSALPETHRRTPSRRKPAASRAEEPVPGDLDTDPPSRAPPPTSAASRSEFTDRATCRADTSAELMCAEAILDISKTILPAPVEGSNTAPPPSPHTPNVPLRSDGDSSSVDSDDSIEQEIRTFLALKAQSGSLLARAEGHPQVTQGLLSPPGPDGQPNSPKAPLSKVPDVQMSCRRKRRGGGQALRPATPKKMKEVEREGGQDADHSQGQAEPSRDGQDPPGQGRTGQAQGRDSEAQTLGDTHVSQGHSKADEARGEDEKGSSEDKSSSLDSDEDLDTAIKDLLRSKRKLRKRGRDPRAACRKKVRFSTTETRFLDRLGSFRRDWKASSPQVLRSCLSKPRRDNPGSPALRPLSVSVSATERTKPEGTICRDTTPAFRLRRDACRGDPFPSDGQGLAPSPSSVDSDTSSVDSDDSIELEIRKFLAEKAKESVSSLESQTNGPGPEAPCRREPAPSPGICTRSQRARGPPQLAEGPRGTERAGVQGAFGLFGLGGKGLPATALAQGDLAPPRSSVGSVPARGGSVSRRHIYVHKDQGPRGAEPATTNGALSQLPGHARAGPEVGATFHMGCGSRGFLASTLGAERDCGAQTNHALPWSDFAHQSRLPGPWVLDTEGRDAAWRGSLGGERGKGTPPGGLPFSSFSPLLSTQLFHFGKTVSWGSKQTGLFSPHLGLPLQGPSFSAFREAQAGPSPVFGGPHRLVKKDIGPWPGRRVQAGHSLCDGQNSGSEEEVLDLRYRHRGIDRDDPDPEALGSDASDLSDTSVEDGGGSSVLKGKVLQL
ncbi:protein phosphatase 1 regulatory subunit 26 [Carlito syrichta]|uniref:Protein phosphatase 1 regulatory subunit 26 n=1 Tax=Carlito syrichta TaxID=1868482 RepID=A0A1U7UT92_CARSF|nr:protein phosphatase 1 regulatory subunit 26 [Carlito syrichta]